MEGRLELVIGGRAQGKSAYVKKSTRTPSVWMKRILQRVADCRSGIRRRISSYGIIFICVSGTGSRRA